MQYVMVLDIEEAELGGDDSIERASRIINDALAVVYQFSEVAPTVRPLSEVITS